MDVFDLNIKYSMLSCRKSTVVVSASLVKELREETGLGKIDYKKDLAETEGDPEAYLREKGLSSTKKEIRKTSS